MEYDNFPSDLVLGVQCMDDSHRALLDALDRLSRLPDDGFCEAYLAWISAVERDFYTEEQAMEEIEFPDIRSHIEQHARVLSALHHAEPRVMEGNIALGREVIALLPQWFETHISTMDRVLAVALRMAGMEKVRASYIPPAS